MIYRYVFTCKYLLDGSAQEVEYQYHIPDLFGLALVVSSYRMV